MKIAGRRDGSAGHFFGKPNIPGILKFGSAIALRAEMSSSLDSIYKKMASSLEGGGAGHVHEAKFDSARHISPVVAHELNNILTIIQGYTDRLLLKHGDNPAFETHLKLISEAAHRASILVRSSAPTEADLAVRPQLNSQQLVPAA
jgi:signal transduction histidine kinase